MYKYFLNAVTLTFLTVFSIEAIADKSGKLYVGAQYAFASFEEEGIKVYPKAIIGKFGRNFSDNFALEARIGTGIKDSDITPATDASVGIDNLFGLYGVGHIQTHKSSSLYALIGFTRTEFTASASGIPPVSDEYKNLSLGVVANIEIYHNLDLSLEYVYYANDSSYKLRTAGVGVSFSF